MNNNQNQFYTSISKFYSEIFPDQPTQLQFVKNRVGELAGKRILDIGCATGELAFQLSETGAKVTGIDLNEDLLNRAKVSKFHTNSTFQKGNMLELENDFKPDLFDVVLCFGNTLVQLESAEQIRQMFQGIFYVLKPGGIFLLQILNYDYILKNQITDLPDIETENIKFIRKYRLGEYQSQIVFQTNLLLKNENETISNETLLLPLKWFELEKLLAEQNFKNIGMFSNYKMEIIGGNHLPLVVSCKK